jgi:hypothetical protein
VFTPRKFQAKQIAKMGGGDLWGYLVGGREQADYYLGPDGTPREAAAELHGRLWSRLGVARLDWAAFGRLAVGCHPVTGQRLIKTSYVTRLDPATGQRVAVGGFHVPGIDCNLSRCCPLAAVELGLLYEWRWRRGDAVRARALFQLAIDSGHEKAPPLAEIHLRA